MTASPGAAQLPLAVVASDDRCDTVAVSVTTRTQVIILLLFVFWVGTMMLGHIRLLVLQPGELGGSRRGNEVRVR